MFYLGVSSKCWSVCLKYSTRHEQEFTIFTQRRDFLPFGLHDNHFIFTTRPHRIILGVGSWVSLSLERIDSLKVAFCGEKGNPREWEWIWVYLFRGKMPSIMMINWCSERNLTWWGGLRVMRSLIDEAGFDNYLFVINITCMEVTIVRTSNLCSQVSWISISLCVIFLHFAFLLVSVLFLGLELITLSWSFVGGSS